MAISPIRISVIIVNYNVEYFLEQCLNSVFDALQHVSGEVFVVDNNSIDGSVQMVRDKFPNVQLIANKENTGFSRANNQAIKLAKGDYVLLLNPDTVVEKDTFRKCVDFMDQYPDGGGLGVHMIDGKGHFLPESKRGLPTPAVAFYKISGLSRIFPKSKKFGRYHLGFLDEFSCHEVEILSGAYMFMRKSVLDKVGLLDETFFMYGEDIDLSYRIIQGGFKNYYFPETQIIHYKGESTKKSSINYVFVFYRAMVIFAEKHFSQKNAKLFSFLINLAIYFRAGLAIFNRFVKKIALPLFDFSILLFGLYSATLLWSIGAVNFPNNILKFALPSYVFIWWVTNFYSGAYDFPLRVKNYIKGTIIGTVLLLVAYALLPKSFQFSRLFILLGAVIVFLYYIGSRLILYLFFGHKFSFKGVKSKNFAIVGVHEEYIRIQNILKITPQKVKAIYVVSPSNEKDTNTIGTIHQLDQIIEFYKIDEVIFSAKNVSADTIMYWMTFTTGKDIEFKIAQPNSMYLIGSNSIDTAGDLYLMEINNISTKSARRNKRTFDVLTSSLLLLFCPISIWCFKNKGIFLKNSWEVLIGKKSWIGYYFIQNEREQQLPNIKKGILNPFENQKITGDAITISKMNLIYARNYNVWKDFQIFFKNWRNLDRSSQ